MTQKEQLLLSPLQHLACNFNHVLCSKVSALKLIDLFHENNNYHALILLIVGQPHARIEKGFSLPSPTAPRGPLYLCQKNA